MNKVVTSSANGSQGGSVRDLSSSENLFLCFQEQKIFVEGSIGRLHRLGVTIRRSSMASLRSRVEAFAGKSNSSIEELCSKAIKRIYPLAPESLQNLLIQSILQRHLTLLYRENHQRNISKRRSSGTQNLDDGQDLEDKAADKVAAPSPILGHTAAPDKVLREGPSTDDSKSGTKPSTLKTDEFRERIRTLETTTAALSAISNVSSAPAEDFLYPKPPKGSELSEIVFCSWCFEPLPAPQCKEAKVQRSAWWRSVSQCPFR